MRATVMRDAELVFATLPDPEPGPGEVLVKTLACGICGSDLHVLEQARKLLASSGEAAAPFGIDLRRDVVMGHEFCAEIVDFGVGTQRRFAPGTRVVSMPFVAREEQLAAVGYSNDCPGGYGEAMVLMESLLLEVPNGLATEHAALTEPMAVGVHAVAMARLAAGDAAVVVGCGPVGLAVIAALRQQQVEPIVASDFSPLRRQLAETMGAHAVVDPAQRPVMDCYDELAALKPAVLFECVGVPGMLEKLMADAPRGARIVVAGVCMEDDRIQPLVGIAKELSIQFVVAYQPEEFASTLRAIAEGEFDVAPLITGRVGVEDVADAFAELRRPQAHAKILVEPGVS
jgi:threonine dehydrogenase-like Zn-dependent dehydrogenase